MSFLSKDVVFTTTSGVVFVLYPKEVERPSRGKTEKSHVNNG